MEDCPESGTQLPRPWRDQQAKIVRDSSRTTAMPSTTMWCLPQDTRGLADKFTNLLHSFKGLQWLAGFNV